MPAILPVLSALTMYGPTATRYCVPNVVGACLSSGATNEAGSGEDSGRLSASMTAGAPGFVRWMTSVVEFGVWMPGRGPPLYLGSVEPTIGAGAPAPK